MTRFEDLSNEEILALEEREIERYIDLECAVEGVGLMPKPPVKPTKAETTKDLTLFYVGGLYLKDADEARELQGVLNELSIWDTKYVGGQYYDKIGYKKKEKFTVSEDLYYSQEQYDKCEGDIDQYNKEVEEYNKLDREYRDLQSKRRDIAKEIYNKVEALRQKETEKIRMLEKFNYYLELAENDPKIAYKFLASAYPGVEEYKDIFNMEAK